MSIRWQWKIGDADFSGSTDNYDEAATLMGRLIFGLGER